jgi:hypothetical protein
MSDLEVERKFVEKMCEYLVTLPFDLKILQEAVTDPDLDKPARLLAASTVFHTLLPQEGEPGPLRYVDDVLYVRAALHEVAKGDSEGPKEFRERFATEVYSHLSEDVSLFQSYLGELWPWLCGKLPSFQKLALKGKKPAQAVDDEDVASLLYDEGLEFQTNYPVNEEQVRNKVRRGDQLLEPLKKRFEEDKKRIG